MFGRFQSTPKPAVAAKSQCTLAGWAEGRPVLGGCLLVLQPHAWVRRTAIQVRAFISQSFSVSGPPNLGPSQGALQENQASHSMADYLRGREAPIPAADVTMKQGGLRPPQYQQASGTGTGGTRAWLFSQHFLCGSEVSHRLGKGQLKQVLRALLQGPCCTLAWSVAAAACLLPHF